MSTSTDNFVLLSGTIGTGIAGFVQFSVKNWNPIEPNIPAPSPVIVPLVAGAFSNVPLLATDNTIQGVPLGWQWLVMVVDEGVSYEPVSFYLPFTGGASQNLNQILLSFASLPFLVEAGGTMMGWLAPAVGNLSVASNLVAVNAAIGNSFNLTLTSSAWTISNPVTPTDGQVIRFRLTQGGSGGFTVAFDTAYDFGSAGEPALSSNPGNVDILGFEYVATISKWCYLGCSLGN